MFLWCGKVWEGGSGQGKAMQGRQGKAWLARQRQAKDMAWHGKEHGMARPGQVRQGKARQGKARHMTCHGMLRHGMPWPGKAGQ